MKCIFLADAYFLRPHRRVLFCALLLLVGVLLPAENVYHTVRNGDTIYSLARQYKVKEADILSINGIADARKIFVGQKLRIPSELSASSAARALLEYRAVQGDTLYGIARKYGISFQELAAVNNFPQNYILKVGNKIKVPFPADGSKPVQQAPKLAEPARQPAKKADPPSAVPPAAPAKAPAQKAPAPPAVPKAPGAPGGGGAKTGNPLGSIEWPVVPKSSAYMKGKLSGVVLTGEKTEPVRSLTSGTVISAGPYRGFGRVVIIKSDGGYDYVYGGCESLSVKKWDRVVPGSEVGKLGVDTLTSKPQLFFMIYHNGKPVDPTKTPHV
jgi:murein DD-endopeptidase MepM/ murein hydrolase activator NlpD